MHSLGGSVNWDTECTVREKQHPVRRFNYVYLHGITFPKKGFGETKTFKGMM